MKCKICGRVIDETSFGRPRKISHCLLCHRWVLRVGTEKWPMTRSKRVNEQIREYILDDHESNSYNHTVGDTTHG
jgi:hypothetical protein